MSNIFTRNGYSNTYGEFTGEGLSQLFKNISVKNKVFYNLGSRKGQVVINAEKIVGIKLNTDNADVNSVKN